MLPKIKQVYTPYWSWECYKNEMYNKAYSDDDYKICFDFMSDTINFGNAMLLASVKWENTMLNHLTNPNINRIAFLGQCAVSIAIGLPQELTKKTWKELTIEKQSKANQISKNIINEWILKQKLKNISKTGRENAIKEGYQMKLNLL